MFEQKSWTAAVMLLAALSVAACSGKKVLPKGDRISVLQEISAIKPEVANAESMISIPPTTKNNEWLQTDYNVQHTGANFGVGTSFKKQWKADFGTGSSKREVLLSKPIISEKTVYTLDADATLSAFNLADGKKLWSVDLLSDNRNVGDTSLKGIGLALSGNAIYVTTGFGEVIAVNTKDGKQIWRNNLKTPLRIAPLIAGNKVFVQSVDNRFYALSIKDGEIIWDYDIAMESTTIVGGAVAAYNKAMDMVVTGFSNGEIQAFSASIGTPLWSDILIANRQAYSSTFLHTIKASPVTEGETVYALGSSDVLAALDMRTGSRKWEKEIGGINTPLLVADTLYVVTDTGNLTAVNKKNGNILWSATIDFGEKSDVAAFAPLMLNDRIVVALSNGRVNTYDPKSGKQMSSIELDENLNSSPVIADGYILFVTSNAKILAYK
ncbi:MAG: PQQ-binding-like beta-propeller repeat protein [Alphaproteobacteria bacterium]|nr:PQQ-binding-like beta-propeller repeat protein [Alphaproteobacteria bacterium]